MKAQDAELVEAIEFHRADVVSRARKLLADGADVDAKRSPKAWRVLHWAVFHGDEELVKALLAAGADVNAQDNADRFAPLHLAHKASIARRLLEAGAEVDAKDKKGITPLRTATSPGNLERSEADTVAIVRALVEAGADVNAQGADGVPALHGAIASMPDDVVDALLEAEAEYRVDAKGVGTALHEAARFRRARVAERLIRQGADVNAIRKEGKLTPLHQAASADALEVARVLVDAGADLEARDSYKRTPAALAQSDAMKQLLSKH